MIKVIYFNVKGSIFETLKENYNDKYEYIFPDINLNKNFLAKNLEVEKLIQISNLEIMIPTNLKNFL